MIYRRLKRRVSGEVQARQRVYAREAGQRVRTLLDDGATGPWKRRGCLCASRSSECQDRRRANWTFQGIWGRVVVVV